ncbi:hypothetical protein FKM82_030890 [Ascaphus truei]
MGLKHKIKLHCKLYYFIFPGDRICPMFTFPAVPTQKGRPLLPGVHGTDTARYIKYTCTYSERCRAERVPWKMFLALNTV